MRAQEKINSGKGAPRPDILGPTLGSSWNLFGRSGLFGISPARQAAVGAVVFRFGYGVIDVGRFRTVLKRMCFWAKKCLMCDTV